MWRQIRQILTFIPRGLPMSIEVNHEVWSEQPLHLQLTHKKKKKKQQMSFVSLERAFRGVNMDFLAFSDGFKALVILGIDSSVFVDPTSLEQQILRGFGIDE